MLYCLTVLVIVLFVSCSKKKPIPVKKTDHTAEIYKLAKKGDSLFELLQYDNAIFHFNKAQSLCNPKKDYADQYVYSAFKIGLMLMRNGDFYSSETVLAKTFPYLKYTSKPRFSQMIYSCTADNYYNTYDYDNALLYHKKALKIAISQFRKAQITSDIGFIYLQQKKYLEAIHLLEPLAKKKVIDQTDALNTETKYSAVLYGLGLCYLRLGNHQKLALDNLNKSLEVSLKTNDGFDLIGNYHALYLYYKKYNNPRLKKFYATKGYLAACKVNSKSNQINSLGELIEAEDGENLKKYIKLYIKLSDSTTLSRGMAKNQFAQIRYDSKLNKEQNLRLKAQKAENDLELEREKSRNIISYVIISFILLLISYLIFHLLLKGKKEKDNAIYESEMRISEKLKQELSTNLYDAIVFAENIDLENPENKEQLLNNLEVIYSRTRNLSKENSFIITDHNYVSELKEMISGFTTPDVNIFSNGLETISWNEINRNKKIILYRIIQELFSNMKKHSEATLVSITFKTTDKKIIVTYTDNGIGATNGKIILKNGLQNVESRIKNINGTINFDAYSQSGFKLNFTFPI